MTGMVGYRRQIMTDHELRKGAFFPQGLKEFTEELLTLQIHSGSRFI
jgi:hypothetical protein